MDFSRAIMCSTARLRCRHLLHGPEESESMSRSMSVGVLKQLRDEANSDIVVTDAAECEHKKTLMN